MVGNKSSATFDKKLFDQSSYLQLFLTIKMARVSNSVANTLNHNASNILGLIQSALDLPTTEVYDFALWLNSDTFVTDKTKKGG
jgi:hypothetical protein